MSQPLTGVTVIEFADLRAEYCGRLLADLGATVVKVELPEGGSSRYLEPLVKLPDGTQTSLVHEYYNANKLSVALDPATPAGRQLLRSLLERAEVLLLGHDLPDLVTWGLDPGQLRTTFPALVITAITGFGLTGPKANWRVTDLIGFAAGGVMSISGRPERPMRAPQYQSYDMAGAHASVGVMVALWERRGSGLGQLVDVAIQESLAIEEHLIARYSEDGGSFSRDGSQHQVAAPGCVYPCRDGFLYLMVSPTRPGDWERFCGWIGNPPELQGPQWDNGAYRRQNHATVDAVTRRFMADKDRDTLCAQGQALRLPCSPIQSPAEFLRHPQTVARDYLVTVIHPQLGEVQFPGPPYQMTPGAWVLRRTAPAIGSDTDRFTTPQLQPEAVVNSHDD